MAVPLLSKKIVKKRVKKFKRPQSDRKISVKVNNQNDFLNITSFSCSFIYVFIVCLF